MCPAGTSRVIPTSSLVTSEVNNEMVEDRPSGYAGRDHNSFLAKNGHCAVESRINNGSLNSKTEEKITFHKFPQDPIKRKQCVDRKHAA